MNTKKIQILLIALALLASILACRLPGAKAPTPIAFPTPNLTLTALFNPNQGVPPTATPNSGGAYPTNPPTSAPTAQPTQPPTAAPTSTTPPTQQPTTPPTAAPTSTPAPTTIPKRPGPRVEAPLLWVAPNKIDGALGDWRTKTEYPITAVVYGANNYSGASDLSGKFRIGWDYRALYIAAIVTDDRLVQTEHGANIFKGDEVEVQLDTNLYGDFYTHYLNADDYQIGLSIGNPPGTSPEAYLWYPHGKARSLPEVQIGVTTNDHGYILEAAIPWTVFGFKPHKGWLMGFAISVSDNDDPDHAVQQTLISNDKYRSLIDPTTWGTLHFYDPRSK